VTIEVRRVTDEAGLRRFAEVHATAFGRRWEEEKVENLILPWLPTVSCVAAFDEGEMVGVSIDQPFEMTLPGGRMTPIRGITWVGVLPTHRGRGVLRSMMEFQQQAFHDEGLLISALYSSETTIYGRFGYGPATNVASEVEIDTACGAFAEPYSDPGQLVLLDDRSPVAVVREVIDRARPHIPGEVDRSQQDLADMFAMAERGEFRVAHRDAQGGHDGFVTYTIEQNWHHGFVAQNRLTVGTFVWSSPAAYAAIWRYLLDMSLVRTVRLQNRPLDEPIRWLLAEWRHYHVRHVTDALWLRLHDVPAALAARGYACDGELVLGVDGRRLLLSVQGGAGGCADTDRESDIELDECALASVYLGGNRFLSLRDAMRLR